MLLSKFKSGVRAAGLSVSSIVAVSALSMSLAPAAQAATVIPLGSPNFFIISGSLAGPSFSAIFFNNYAAGANFDDIYTFTIPQNGVGSGSVSTSFSSDSNKIVLTSLVVNGTPYGITANSGGQAAAVGGISIVALSPNSIQLTGNAVGSGGYTGTVTFTALAVPEPQSWALMLGGFALLGFALRRRQRVAVQFG